MQILFYAAFNLSYDTNHDMYLVVPYMLQLTNEELIDRGGNMNTILLDGPSHKWILALFRMNEVW